jgi:Arc/MetJ-type ribon-helix-helix transcriptional regulator
MMRTIVVPVRLDPSLVEWLDEQVREGRAATRSDAVRKTLLARYQRRKVQ